MGTAQQVSGDRGAHEGGGIVVVKGEGDQGAGSEERTSERTVVCAP